MNRYWSMGSRNDPVYPNTFSAMTDMICGECVALMCGEGYGADCDNVNHSAFTVLVRVHFALLRACRPIRSKGFKNMKLAGVVERSSHAKAVRQTQEKFPQQQLATYVADGDPREVAVDVHVVAVLERGLRETRAYRLLAAVPVQQYVLLRAVGLMAMMDERAGQSQEKARIRTKRTGKTAGEAAVCETPCFGVMSALVRHRRRQQIVTKKTGKSRGEDAITQACSAWRGQL